MDIPKMRVGFGALRLTGPGAWELHRSPVVLPIPGTRSLDHLAENVAAASVDLSADQLTRL